MSDFTKDELDSWFPDLPPSRCDMCKADTAEWYVPENKYNYTGLCKSCFRVFGEQNPELFE